MRANAWEGIGNELKIKRKFYVSSRDVRIVCPRLKDIMSIHIVNNVILSSDISTDNFGDSSHCVTKTITPTLFRQTYCD